MPTQITQKLTQNGELNTWTYSQTDMGGHHFLFIIVVKDCIPMNKASLNKGILPTRRGGRIPQLTKTKEFTQLLFNKTFLKSTQGKNKSD